MDIEGIIISKTPYKERDLICNLLLRSGKKVSVYFYGGRGGGKKNKGSILEVGFMLKILLNERRKKIESNIKIAKEHKLLWDCDNIRTDFKAFYLACFFMEYIAKIAIADELEEVSDSEHEGLFNVLSNGLFFLDQAVGNKSLDLNSHLFIFLTKLAAHLGIGQDVEHCIFCEKNFVDQEVCLFNHQDGGFSCLDCSSKRDEYLSDNKLLREEYLSSQELRISLKKVYQLPYKSYGELSGITQGLASAEFNFINYQFGFTKDQIKSWEMVSAQ